MSTIVTVSGRVINFLDPDPRQIDIGDIATGLANVPRFAGQTLFPYSVAQHSVLCAQYCPTHRLEALLHDATEAYMGDCNRPLKDLLGDAWRGIEGRLHAAICQAFGIDSKMPQEVKLVDNRMLESERRVVQKPCERWKFIAKPLDGVVITRWTPAVARTKFLRAFHKLTKER